MECWGFRIVHAVQDQWKDSLSDTALVQSMLGEAKEPIAAIPCSQQPKRLALASNMTRGRRNALWVLVAATTVGALGPAFIDSLRPGREQWTDFFQDWASARNHLIGLPIYSPHRLAVREHLGHGLEDTRDQLRTVARVITYNPHPPASVLIALPFAKFSYPNAVLLWNLFSLAALAASLWMIRRELVISVSVPLVCGGVTALLLCGPLWMQVILAQFNLIILLLLTATWVMDRKGHQHVAGFFLGVATAIKLYPGFAILYFLVRRRARVVRWAAITFALVVAASTAVLGSGTFTTYLAEVLPEMRLFRAAWNNASLPGFWRKLFDPPTGVPNFLSVHPLLHSPWAATTGAVLSCAALIAVTLAVTRSAQSREQHDEAYAITLVAMLLVSPVTWDHYLLVLLLPLAVYGKRLPELPRATGAGFLICAVLIWVNPRLLYKAFIPGGITGGMPSALHTLGVLSLQCYALLGLFCLGCWWELRNASSAG